MIKQPFFILSFLLFAAVTVQSQAPGRIAVVAGANSSNVIENNSLPVWSYNGNIPDWDAVRKKYSSRISFHAGIIAQIRFSEKSGWYFEPGIILYNKGRGFNSTTDTLALKKRN